MRIVCIVTKKDFEEFKTAFRRNNVCEEENLLLFKDFDIAREFIIDSLIGEQGHIDVIITSERLKQSFHQHLVDWIRYGRFEYSRNNFRLSTIPIILYDTEVNSLMSERNFGYTAIVSKFSSDESHDYLCKIIKQKVKAYRNYVHDDLDDLNIDLNELNQSIIYSPDFYYLRETARYADTIAPKLRILSQTFVSSPQRLDYDWLQTDWREFAKALELYEKILKSGIQFDKSNSEKRIFHKFFNDYKWTLTRDVYAKQYYEQALMKNKTEYEEPDYILASAMPKHLPTTVFEVKLPDVEIIAKRKRKPKFLDGFEEGLIQTADYYRYFKKKGNKKEMGEKILGYEPKIINYKLLSSTDLELNKNETRIRELMNDHYPMVQLVTHDDLYSIMERYVERIFT